MEDPGRAKWSEEDSGGATQEEPRGPKRRQGSIGAFGPLGVSRSL